MSKREKRTVRRGITVKLTEAEAYRYDNAMIEIAANGMYQVDVIRSIVEALSGDMRDETILLLKRAKLKM